MKFINIKSIYTDKIYAVKTIGFFGKNFGLGIWLERFRRDEKPIVLLVLGKTAFNLNRLIRLKFK